MQVSDLQARGLRRTAYIRVKAIGGLTASARPWARADAAVGRRQGIADGRTMSNSQFGASHNFIAATHHLGDTGTKSFTEAASSARDCDNEQSVEDKIRAATRPQGRPDARRSDLRRQGAHRQSAGAGRNRRVPDGVAGGSGHARGDQGPRPAEDCQHGGVHPTGRLPPGGRR